MSTTDQGLILSALLPADLAALRFYGCAGPYAGIAAPEPAGCEDSARALCRAGLLRPSGESYEPTAAGDALLALDAAEREPSIRTVPQNIARAALVCGVRLSPEPFALGWLLAVEPTDREATASDRAELRASFAAHIRALGYIVEPAIGGALPIRTEADRATVDHAADALLDACAVEPRRFDPRPSSLRALPPKVVLAAATVGAVLAVSPGIFGWDVRVDAADPSKASAAEVRAAFRAKVRAAGLIIASDRPEGDTVTIRSHAQHAQLAGLAGGSGPTVAGDLTLTASARPGSRRIGLAVSWRPGSGAPARITRGAL